MAYAAAYLCSASFFCSKKSGWWTYNIKTEPPTVACLPFNSAAMSLCHGSPQEPVADEKHFVSCLENHDIVVFLTQPWNRTIWTVQAMVLLAMCKHKAQRSFVKVVHCTGSTRDIFIHSYHQMLLLLHLCKLYSLGPLRWCCKRIRVKGNTGD